MTVAFVQHDQAELRAFFQSIARQLHGGFGGQLCIGFWWFRRHVHLHEQVESLAAQLREEKDLRADADKEIERTLREHNQTLEKRLRATSDQLSQLERDMADRLTQEAQSLREEIKRKNEDLQHAIEKMFAELSNVKTDRNLLAGLFVEVAKCLNQDAASAVKGGIEPSRGRTAS